MLLDASSHSLQLTPEWANYEQRKGRRVLSGVGIVVAGLAIGGGAAWLGSMSESERSAADASYRQYNLATTGREVANYRTLTMGHAQNSTWLIVGSAAAGIAGAIGVALGGMHLFSPEPEPSTPGPAVTKTTP